MVQRIELDEERLKDLLQTQMTIQEIADEFGVHKATIERRLRALGLRSPHGTGPRRGELHPSWKGGSTMRKGYRYLYRPDHPSATKAGYVQESRLVMEKELGRFLLRTEVVHHKDRDRLNNDPSNLEVFDTNADHLRHELTGKCPRWSEGGKARIRDRLQKSSDHPIEFGERLRPRTPREA